MRPASRPVDPWTSWYAAYRVSRERQRAEAARRRDRKRRADQIAGLLIGYMLAGGVLAGIAVKLVLAH